MQAIAGKVFVGVMLVLVPQSALAFVATFNTLPEPYAVYDIDITDPQSYYGHLDGFPDTYQFVLAEETLFAVSLFAYAHNKPAVRFAGILVREREEGGVAEITRLRVGDADWEEVTDKETKLRYLEGPAYSTTLAPGTYRFEVSNPENVGRYMLQVGEVRGSQGYFATLGDLRAVYNFHGQSAFGLLRVPHVYLPIGIVVVLVLFYLTLRSRKISVS